MTDPNEPPQKPALPPVRQQKPSAAPAPQPPAVDATHDSTSTTVTKPKKRGLGIPLLITLGLLAALGGGWYALNMQKNKVEAAAAEKIQSLGGLTVKDGTRKHIASLNTVTVRERDDFDAIMASVGGLYRLQILDLSKSPVTSEQLAGLSGLTKLTTLQLDATAVQDDDLRHFRRMNQLLSIYLADTNISSRGLEEISKLSSLKMLKISNTKMDDLSSLAQLPNLNWLLCRRETPFSDADVDALSKLKAMKRLTVNPDQLTGEQTAQLKKALPGLVIE